MTYYMFIDDERMPQDAKWANWYKNRAFGKWVICRSMSEAIEYFTKFGCPNFISFDHDLGRGQPTGFDIAKFLVNAVLDEKITLPETFDFSVHSKNPIGAENIESLLRSFMLQL